MAYGPPTTHILFGITGLALRSQEITSLLRVEPTEAFDRGQSFAGRHKTDQGIQPIERVRRSGVWHYSSEGQFKDASLDEHAVFLLEKLEPSFNAIRRLCENPDLFVRVTIWYVGHGRFTMQSELMRRLAMICEEVAVTFSDTDEDDSLD